MSVPASSLPSQPRVSAPLASIAETIASASSANDKQSRVIVYPRGAVPSTNAVAPRFRHHKGEIMRSPRPGRDVQAHWRAVRRR
jgi:hypothetical protein